MSSLLAPLRLVAARGRHRPGLWVAPALGIAVAAAFLAGVAAEGTLAGDQAARSTLAGLAPVDGTVRVTWQGKLTRPAARDIAASLGGLPTGGTASVVLLDPVRLNGMLVRPAAIAPMDRWVPRGAAARLGPCRPESCPMLLASRGHLPGVLTASGVRIKIAGSTPLGSAIPLGFAPATSSGPPVLLTSDVAGLDALEGLGGVYRVHSRVATLGAARLHSWQLDGLEDRLARAQASIEAIGTQFSVSGPFAGLDAARTQARAAPRRLLLAGGGALTALALFVVLVGAGMRRDQLVELARLGNAGARLGHSAVFVAAESGAVATAGLAAGAGLGIVVAEVLAQASGGPAGGVLAHSLLTWQAALTLAALWLGCSGLLAAAVLVRRARALHAVALAAAVALVVALTLDAGHGDAFALMLAPLCCIAAGVLVWRAAAGVLRGGEKLFRRGPVPVRLALVGLARAPALPALAISFVAVSVGLGGFALAYRATQLRGAADQAADRVPLDAIVSAGPNFAPPLAVVPLARWRELAGGTVLPVRRTEANYLRDAGTVTVPALGIPTAGVSLIHGWRASDGSAPWATLARRLRPRGPIRVAGPALPAGADLVSLRAASPALAVAVTAEVRAPGGAIRRLALGTVGARARWLRARLPPGRWELEALELDEPTGLEITNGHQNGENPAAATQQQVRVALGPVVAWRGNRALLDVPLGGWRGVGAASGAGGRRGAAALVGFATSGAPGIVRPSQPSDTQPIPVLADPRTAGAAGRFGRLQVTVDGLPVSARVVGTLRRFPTLDPGAGGLLLADEPTLSSALDAQLPGQGRPDELWISAAHLAPLRRALAQGPLAQLSATFRDAIERRLSSQPIARGVERTLLTASFLWAGLAVLGLLTALLGAGRDRSVESDLREQGIGPRGLRTEARVRIATAGLLGVGAGIALALLLTRLAVAGVSAAATAAVPRPPLVTVVPWTQLAAWAAAVLVTLAVAGWLATSGTAGQERTRRVRQRRRSGAREATEGVAR